MHSTNSYIYDSRAIATNTQTKERRHEMNNISYYSPVDANGYRYSADAVNIEALLSSNCVTSLDDFAKIIGKNCAIKSCESRMYSQSYRITLPNQEKLSISLSARSGLLKCYISCNPNNTFYDSECERIIKYFIEHSISSSIKKIDIAIDIPIKFDLLFPEKDRRALRRSQYSNASNATVYWGKRNKAGAVKLYDKRKEADLDYDLSRIEITVGNPLSNSWDINIRKWIPKVWIKTSSKQADLPEQNLSSTDKVLISLFNENFKSIRFFRQLDRKKQKKLKPYISGTRKPLEIDVEAMKQVALNLYTFLEVKDSVYMGDSLVIAPICDEEGSGQLATEC